MESIKFIKDFWFDGQDRNLYTSGKYFLTAAELFIHDGGLGASSAVNSLMMMLMIHGRTNMLDLSSRKEEQSESEDGYIAKKCFQEMCLRDMDGRYQNNQGYDFKKLSEDLHECFMGHAEADYMMLRRPKSNSKRKIALKQRIIKRIDEGYPVEIGFTFDRRSCGHAVVAIGYTYHKHYLRLLCLDPANERPKVSFWNSVIDIDNSDDYDGLVGDFYCTEAGFKHISVNEILTIK